MRVRRSQHLTAAVIALTFSSASLVNGAPALERMAGWPYAGAQAVALDTDRDLAFLSSGGAILAIDVSTPATPQLLHDGMHTSGHVRDLRYVSEDHRLYVADWSGGLEIWDVTTPDIPRRLSAVRVYYIGTDSDMPTDNLVVVDDYLYINATEARVHGFDISNPIDPIDLGFHAGPLWYPPYYERETNDVAVSGGYVYVAGDGIAKFIILGDGTLNKVGEYLDSTGVSCIEIGGGNAYVGHGYALQVFDVSGPYPTMLGDVTVADGLNDVAVIEDMVIGVNGNGLFVFDVSTPEQPVQIGSLPLHDGYRIRLDGNIAYVTGDSAGLQVIDISDPNQPALIGNYDTVGSTAKVTVSGRHAFLGQVDEDLVILDVDDSNAVQFLSQSGEGTTNETLLIGDYLYVTDWYAQALRVVDVSDVNNPVDVGGVYDFYAVGLATDGQYLYVTRFSIETQLYYLHVFSLADPTSPVELSTMTMSPFIFGFEYGNGHLFAVEFYDAGLHIISVEDPYNPHEVELYPVNWGEDVWIQGNYAYVASFIEGLIVLDITDPANPVYAGGVNEVYMFEDIAVSGDLAFATSGASTQVLTIYDVSDLSNIVELDSIELPGEAWDLTVQGTYAYIAGGYTGLQIIRAGDAPGDVDGDEDVDTADLLLLLAAWGDCPEPPEECPADFDNDGDVDVADLLILLANWG